MGRIKFNKGDSERQPVERKARETVSKPVFSVVSVQETIQKPVFNVKESKEHVVKPVFLIEEKVEVIKKPSFSVETVDFIMDTEANIKKLEQEVKAQNKIMAIGFGLLSIINILILFAR
jgi:hypothetical protein